MPDKSNLKEVNVYFGSVLQISVMATWLYYFWGYGKAKHHGGVHMVEQSAHPMVPREQKEIAHFENEAPCPQPIKVCICQWTNPLMRLELF